MTLPAVIILSSIFAVIFSGSETAFFAMERGTPATGNKASFLRSAMLRIFISNRDTFLLTMLAGYVVSVTIFVISSARLPELALVNRFVHPEWIFLIHLFFIVIIVLLFFELFPKIFFGRFPESMLAILSLPLVLIFYLFYPAIFLTGWVITGISGLFGKDRKPDFLPSSGYVSGIMSKFWLAGEEINSANTRNTDEKEVILYRNALDFSKVKLREIMVPRNEIAVLDINSDIEVLRNKFVETGFSKILIYEYNKDNIVGYVHISAIFQKARSIKPHLKNVLIVPETMAANKLLSRFIHEHRSIALVVDEFGGTAGLVTSEDILEEIFGEIEDEHDTTGFVEKRLSDTQFILSGRIEIDTLNEKYNLKIPDSDEYETVAGYILYHFESIPKPNTVIRAGGLSFRILKATLTKIELVQLTILDDL